MRQAIERKPDTEGAYYLLLRALFASGQYQEVARLGDAALEASGGDYNVYVPIMNALGALGKKDALDKMRQREIQALETHIKTVPEDARARTLLAGDYASLGPGGRRRARGEPRHLAAAQRGDRALQRGLRLLPARARSRRRSPRSRRPGTPASATPTGRAATPTSRSSTASRSSRGCTPPSAGTA